MWFALLLSFTWTSSEAAKILCVFPFPSPSHQMVYQIIWEELAVRGHEITVITTHPAEDISLKENITQIDIGNIERLLLIEHDFINLIYTENNLLVLIEKMLAASQNISEEFFLNRNVQSLLSGGNNFDLIFGELAFPAWFGLKDVFNCPLILMNPMPISLVGHDSVGNPSHPVAYADFNLHFGPRLGFFERLVSVIYSVYMRYVMHFRHYPDQDEIARKYLGDEVRNVMDIQNHVDAIFSCTIPGFHPPRPVVPTYIELFGFHVKPKQALPKDLKQFMDEASDGVIYIGFGSTIKSNMLPQATIDILLETFAQLPYKIVWKFEEDLPGKPSNVFAKSWFPQADLLRHPNVKLFITHGGHQSICEAIFGHVPLIGMPFVGDQFYNTLRFEPLGIGISLDKDKLNVRVLKNAILEVAGNPQYRLKMKTLADLAIDQPIKPLDKAIWWMEYVIRHKGAGHLRNPTVDMPLYQYFLLDVLAFLLLCVFVVLYCVKRIIAYLIGRLHCRNLVKTKLA